MDRAKVIEAVTALTGIAPEESLVSLFLEEAETVDSSARAPGTDDYVPTYEPYWLAARLAEHYSTQGYTKRLSVDGDTIEKVPADWSALAKAMYRKSLASRGLPVSGGDGEFVVDLSLAEYDKASG